MFHEDSFDTRSYDDRSWLFGTVIPAVTKRLRQTFITAIAAYTFITQTPNETTVNKRG